ncbi:GNAT family N-acetyltransferase [Candidatus Woesearchaeota archaeon]|nr:GNAT family N-acetyltransferase [Candidatus Woesearchaeota archaeon]
MPKKEDINLLLEFYNQLSIEEGKLQFPYIHKKEMKEYLKRNNKKTRYFFKKHLKDKRHNIFLFAVINKEIVGYIHGEIKKGKGHFERIFVKKEYRGKGISTRLFKKLERKFKQKGVKEILSNHFYNNLPSEKLHEKLGFRPYSIEYRKKI